ncbi:MAG: amino acid permease, partial [Acidobacteriota bacterium]
MKPARNSISLTTATSIAIANMVGTGVFTSLGFQLADLSSGFSILLLWVLGGLIALCGALTYGELASALPRSGGELNFLTHIYHPSVGFLAGWISVVVGFTLPIALAAMAFGSYFSRVIASVSPLALSCGVVAVISVAHLRDLRIGSLFQNLFTLFKVLLIVGFIAAAVALGDPSRISFAPTAEAWGEITGGPFAIALLYVMYAYTGWNASVYVMDEVERPEVTVPRSLILATGIVALLYTLLNWAFLVSAPASAMAGQVDVGHVAAEALFGPAGGRFMSAALSLALVSTISAMIWAGPRVAQVIGQDYPIFGALARTNRHGVPVTAVIAQSALVLVLLVTSTFEQLLVFTQFTLGLCSALTVLGVFVLRRRAPDLPRAYRVWGYPFTPLFFLVASLAVAIFTFIERPLESIAGLVTVLLGLPV